MPLPVKTAIGERGSWFAKIDGKRYPCVHSHWTQWQGGKLIYRDGGYNSEAANPKWKEFIDALENVREVIVTDDVLIERVGCGAKFKRQGYFALYTICNVVAGSQALTFDFISRRWELEY
jgi:hypothetical protein